MEFITLIKTAWTVVVGWMSAVLFYFLPISEIINGLLIAFALSFLFGIIAGLRVQAESISKDKAFVAFRELSIYLLILAAIYTIGDKMSSKDFTYQIIGTITWGMIYFYLTSFFKNASRLAPNSIGLKYIHYVIALEFLKKYPSLKNFQNENEAKESE